MSVPVEKMAKKSIGSLMRKKLSDITNSHSHSQQDNHHPIPLDTYPSDKDCIQQLLKVRTCPFPLPFFSILHLLLIIFLFPWILMQERATFIQLLAERKYPPILVVVITLKGFINCNFNWSPNFRECDIIENLGFEKIIKTGYFLLVEGETGFSLT